MVWLVSSLPAAWADTVCVVGPAREPYCSKDIIVISRSNSQVTYDSPHREADTTQLIEAERKKGEQFEITQDGKDDRAQLIKKWKAVGTRARVVDAAARSFVAHDVHIRYSAPEGSFLTCEGGICNFTDLLQDGINVKLKAGGERWVALADIDLMRQEQGLLHITLRAKGSAAPEQVSGTFISKKISGGRLVASLSGIDDRSDFKLVPVRLSFSRIKRFERLP